MRYFFILLISLSIVACDNPRDMGTAIPTAEIVGVQDLGVITQDSNLRGRDGGYSGLHQGENLWVFGDTVISEANTAGYTWLSSSYSISSDLNASDGLSQLQLGTDDRASPIELFTYTEAESAYIAQHNGDDCDDPCGARWALWPGPVISDEQRQRSVMFYSKIHAEPGEFNFYGVGQSLAIWNYDQPRPVRLLIAEVPDYPTLLFGAEEPQFGPGAFSVGDTLYAYACDRQGVVKPCKLARVTLASVSDKSTWEYYNGAVGWSSSLSLSELFLGNDIMSVSFNEFLNKYVAVYSEPLSRNIKLRTANKPEGPWSTPVHITEAKSSANGNGWVYDALQHSELDEENGRLIYVTYTRDPGEAVREMRLLRIELAKK